MRRPPRARRRTAAPNRGDRPTATAGARTATCRWAVPNRAGRGRGWPRTSRRRRGGRASTRDSRRSRRGSSAGRRWARLRRRSRPVPSGEPRDLASAAPPRPRAPNHQRRRRTRRPWPTPPRARRRRPSARRTRSRPAAPRRPTRSQRRARRPRARVRTAAAHTRPGACRGQRRSPPGPQRARVAAKTHKAAVSEAGPRPFAWPMWPHAASDHDRVRSRWRARARTRAPPPPSPRGVCWDRVDRLRGNARRRSPRARPERRGHRLRARRCRPTRSPEAPAAARWRSSSARDTENSPPARLQAPRGSRRAPVARGPEGRAGRRRSSRSARCYPKCARCQRARTACRDRAMRTGRHPRLGAATMAATGVGTPKGRRRIWATYRLGCAPLWP